MRDCSRRLGEEAIRTMGGGGFLKGEIFRERSRAEEMGLKLSKPLLEESIAM